MLLARFCATSKLSHLGRTLQPDRLAPWADQIDNDMDDCLAHIVDADPSSNNAVACFRLPLDQGGFGFTPVRWSLHAAFVAARIQA
eukprot:6689069-Prorocentrum_lima.AAC.1